MKRHLTCGSTCTPNSGRNGDSCVRATLRCDKPHSIKSLDRRLVDFCLLPDIRFQQRVRDNIVDVDHGLPGTLVQRFALVSIAYLQDHVDPR